MSTWVAEPRPRGRTRRQQVHHVLPLPQLRLHQEVDDAGHAALHLVGKRGHDFRLEVATEPLPVEQLPETGEAQALVEERVATTLEVEQRLLDVRQAQAEVAGELALLPAQAGVDRREGGEVALEQREAAFDPLSGVAQRAARDAEGALQLEAEAFVLVERGRDPRLERGEAAALEGGRVALLAGAPCLPGRQREDLGLHPERVGRPLAYERHDLLEVRLRAQQVGLVEKDHDLLAPLADRLEERPLALRVGPVRRRDEEHEVGAGQEIAGERLVLAEHGVGAGRVHDRDRAQDLDRRPDLADAVGARRARELRPVPQDPHARGGGRDPFLQDLGAEQAVDERALARVELPHHHEQERQRELLVRVRERLSRDRLDAKALERGADLADEPARVVEERPPGGIEGEPHRVIVSPNASRASSPGRAAPPPHGPGSSGRRGR